MSLADDQVGLGAEDYSDKPDGVSQFLSKPTQRAYQPFGGPKRQQNIPSVFAPQQDYYVEPAQQPYSSFDDAELDEWDRFNKQKSYLSSDATAHSASASQWEKRYDDFVEKELKPFHKGLDIFGDQATDDDFITQIDELYESTLKTRTLSGVGIPTRRSVLWPTYPDSTTGRGLTVCASGISRTRSRRNLVGL